MGLFSFLKNVGQKLFKHEEKKPAVAPTPAAPVVDMTQKINEQRANALKILVDSLGLKVTDLSIAVDNDQATLYGQADTQAEKEKVILAVGNVEGIATVDDQMTVLHNEPEAEFYEVKKGDTLSKIAKQFYGNANKYHAIFEANKPMLKDPDLIYPGQVLRIPK